MAPPRQILRQQLEVLTDYLEENKDMIKGITFDTGSVPIQQHIRQKWTEIANKLNAVESGAIRTPERWKKYWFEWRAKCRKKAVDARRFQSGSSRCYPISDLEIRVIELCGKGSGNYKMKKTTGDSSKLSNLQLENFIADREDSDAQPLENIKVKAGPVKKAKQKKSIITSKAALEHQLSDCEPRSTTPPPKWALDIEERRIAAEERMAAALESIASVMHSQEERRAMLDERIADAITVIAGTAQDLNNGMQEALQHLNGNNPLQTNGPDFKGNFML